MSTLETQYKNYLKENPESTFTFEKWSDWKFSNMEVPPPHNGLRPIDEYAEELSVWDVTLIDGLEDEVYISDDFQIRPDKDYEYNNNMTPKEKADKLVDVFYQTTPNEALINEPIELSLEYKAWQQAKQCALICCNEVLGNMGADRGYIFWLEVKQEVEKL